jgi:hypothetical protein
VTFSSLLLKSYTFCIINLIAQQQSCVYKELKLKLKTGETAVICDFSENYSIVQDEVQCFHLNNAQATLHPFVAYYSQN